MDSVLLFLTWATASPLSVMSCSPVSSCQMKQYGPSWLFDTQEAGPVISCHHWHIVSYCQRGRVLPSRLFMHENLLQMYGGNSCKIHFILCGFFIDFISNYVVYFGFSLNCTIILLPLYIILEEKCFNLYFRLICHNQQSILVHYTLNP